MTARSLTGNPVFYVGLVLIMLGVLGLQLGLYSRINSLFFETSNNHSSSNLLAVNTLLNYGNGTSTWHNETNIPVGWNFYQLTVSIARVDSYSSPGVQNEHYIKAIDGVAEKGAYYWTLWFYCQSKQAWFASPVGADLVHLSNNQVLAWFYQNPPSSDPSTWQSPVPGQAKVSMCS